MKAEPGGDSYDAAREIHYEETNWKALNVMNFPVFVLVLSFLVLFLAAHLGDLLRNRVLPLKEEVRNDFGVVLGATLTLLGLLIGFSFSMAVSRYDQRKNYEEAEANAIGTEYLRADLLSGGNAARVHESLRKYVDQRVLFYTTRNQQRLGKINADTAELQNALGLRSCRTLHAPNAFGCSCGLRHE